MNIFEVISNIYVNKNAEWVENIDYTTSSVIVLKFLSMNPRRQNIVAYLSRFVYMLETKHFCLLAWAVIPKEKKAPFYPYMKISETEEMYADVLKVVQKRLKMSDNDFKACKKYILSEIGQNRQSVFSDFGIDRKTYEKYSVCFESGKVEKEKYGLSLFF